MSFCVKTSKRPPRTLCRAVPGPTALTLRDGKKLLAANEHAGMCPRCLTELSGLVMLEAFRADLDGAL